MKNVKLEIHYDLCSLEELSALDRELVERAMKATDNSYAKYSRFCVGAAARLANGQVVIGANQENAAYPSGLCAERTCIFSAQANYPDQPILTLAVAARNENGFIPDPIAPCGACRQVILEIEDRYRQPVRVLLYGTNGTAVVRSVTDLLPLSFVDASMHA